MTQILDRAKSYVKRNFIDSWKVQIGQYPVGDRYPTFIIAEIGINHNGSVEVAKKLIDATKDAGAQAVKFQKRTVSVVYTAEELAKPRAVDRTLLENAVKRGVLSKEAVKRLQDSNFENSTNGDLKYALEFTPKEYKEIMEYAKQKGIVAFASPWDEESVDVLEEFDVPVHKIASASLTDWDLLKHLKSKGKPIIISSGMSTMEEVRKAMDILGDYNVILMHTVSTYPAEDEHLNLRVIETLKNEFPRVPVGYSGHERGVSNTVAAVAMGACVVERHITLDRAMYGSDQAASIEPKELKDLVDSIRRFEKARGDGVKRLVDVEEPVKKKLRRK